MSIVIPTPSDIETVSFFVVRGKVNGIRDRNAESLEKVCIRESKWNGKGEFTFEGRSFTLLRWKAGGWRVANGHLLNGVNGNNCSTNGNYGRKTANPMLGDHGSRHVHG